MWLTKKYFHVTVIQWILFFICVFILIVYLLCQFAPPHPEKYISKNKNKINILSLDKILEISENGDVIFFSGDTSSERTCRWFSGCIFSHVGVLFREKHPTTGEDIVYIFDCDVGQGTKDGVRIMPLKDKLDRYKGFRIGALKKLNVSQNKNRPSYENMMNLVRKYSHIDFDEKIVTWWFAGWPKIYRKLKNEKTMFCSELIALVYQELGIIKKDKVAAWYSPKDFYVNKLHFEKGFSLSENYFFHFPKIKSEK